MPVRIVIGLLVTVVGFGIAARRFHWLSKLIRSGKKDPNRSRGPIRFKVEAETVEVAGQRKLLQWTVPGLAHFFTMWGELGVAQHNAWRTIQRAHAIANGVYVGVVNRVGLETGDIRGNSVPGKGLEFWGGSFFCDPFGRVLAEASHDKEEIVLGEVDLESSEDIRRNWPFLRDRRIDTYAPITSRMLDGK